MKHITLCLPEAYITGIENLVNAKMYPNKSECIRIAVRDLLKTELPLIQNQKRE